MITGGVQKNTARGNVHPSRDGTSRRRLDQTCKTQTVQKEGELPAKRQPAAPKNRNEGSREKRRPAKDPARSPQTAHKDMNQRRPANTHGPRAPQKEEQAWEHRVGDLTVEDTVLGRGECTTIRDIQLWSRRRCFEAG